MRRLRGAILTVTLGLAIAGCQWLPLAGPGALPGFVVDRTPAVLTEPRVFDWTFHSIGGKQVASKREAHLQRQLLAYPTATYWAGGLSLTSLGCAAGDTMPNGPATVFATKSTPMALGNKVFLLTKAGKFIRVDRADPAAYLTLNLGRTFSRTYVTLSPSASRAYVVSDDGTFFVVDTQTMTVLAQASLGAGAYGCAAVFDPYTADHAGRRDEIYISDNAGYVNKFTWSNGVLSGVTQYAVATSVTPIGGGTNKIAAPLLTLGGVIYVGDQGGGFRMYDTKNTANNVSFYMGAPVDTAPAIEIQDGSYALTNPDGSPKSVARGMPIYAFVAAGANCFWLDLHSQKATRSMPLYLDGNDTKSFGYLHQYNYTNRTTTAPPIHLSDWCAIRTDHDSVLAGADAGLNKTKEWIAAGEKDAVYGDGSDAGGPVVCYLRFSTGSSTPSVVKKLTLKLTVEAGGWTKMPTFRSCDSSFLKGTSTVWDFTSLTNANRPDINTTNVGYAVSSHTVNAWGNTQLNPGTPVQWDLSEGFTGGASSDYTIVYMYDQAGKVLWRSGEQTGGTGSKADIVEGVLFRTPDHDNEAHRPVIQLSTSVGSFPSPTIETSPVIDAYRKKVYIFYCNALYEISFGSTNDFQDADSATPKTLFNTTRLGRNATVGGVAYAGSAGYATNSDGDKTKFVNNTTAPVFNYNLTYAYMLDRFPSDPTQTAPTVWDYGLSKVALPLSSGADRLVTSVTPPRIDDVTGSASNFMVIDPFTDSGSTGGNAFFGLGNGRVYQYDR